jgi:2'-5' RNA ligase
MLVIQPLRLFFAVTIPPIPELRTVVEPLERWSTAVRPVPSEQWHLTVRFLGDTEPDQVCGLREAAANIAAGIAPFALSLSDVGTFSMRGRLSVIWIGIEVHPALQQLHEELEAAAVTLGFLPERRPFRPHLTIGRFKAASPPALQKWLETHRATSCGRVDIEAFELVRSQLTPHGAVHQLVERWTLGKTNGKSEG